MFDRGGAAALWPAVVGGDGGGRCGEYKRAAGIPSRPKAQLKVNRFSIFFGCPVGSLWNRGVER